MGMGCEMEMGIALGARGSGIVGSVFCAHSGTVGAGAVCAGRKLLMGCTLCGMVGIHAGMVGAGTNGVEGGAGTGAA